MESEQPRTATSDWKWLRREVIIRDDYTCQDCGAQGGRKGDANLHAHHKTPKAEGGEDTKENLITLCASCHRSNHKEDNTGHFEESYADNDFLNAVSELGGAGTTDIAEQVGCNRRTAYVRLNELEDKGEVTSKKIGKALYWETNQ